MGLARSQEQHILDEFTLAIVGIGALFFAYGQLQTINVKLIVALIGLGASLILWNDMNEAIEKRDATKALLLKDATNELVKVLSSVNKESHFLEKWYQQPSARLKTHFMLLVAWAVIIIYRLSYALIHTQSLGLGISLGIPLWVLDWIVRTEYLASAVILVWSYFLLRREKSKERHSKSHTV